jgi:hypothetical protein
MNAGLAAITGLVAALASHGAASRTATSVYTDSLRAFNVAVPSGWHAEAVDGKAGRGRHAFLRVSNRRPGLRLNMGVAGSPASGADLIAAQLQPGTVCVEFAYAEGPGQVAEYGPGREDTFEQERRFFMYRPHLYRHTDRLDWYDLSFTKWGTTWSVWIACRKPYRTGDRTRAFDMVASLKFHERPIVNDAQAVGAAMVYLPELAQPQVDANDCRIGGWPANGGRHGGYETRVEPIDRGFIVTFVRYIDTDSDVIAAVWHYLVRPDGAVTPLPGG